MTNAADRLLEELAEKVDKLTDAKAVVVTLQAEVARAAARLILETGGEVPLLPRDLAPARHHLAAPAAPESPAEGVTEQPAPQRPARKRASNGKRRRRARLATSAPSGAVEPATSALFGGPRPGGGRGGRRTGVPTVRQSALELLKHRGPTRSSDIVRALGRDPNSTWRVLRKLVSDGVLVRGEGPDALYSLSGEGPPP